MWRCFPFNMAAEKILHGSENNSQSDSPKIAPKKGINRAKKSKLTKIRKTKNERNSKTRCIMISVRPRFYGMFYKIFPSREIVFTIKEVSAPLSSSAFLSMVSNLEQQGTAIFTSKMLSTEFIFKISASFSV